MTSQGAHGKSARTAATRTVASVVVGAALVVIGCFGIEHANGTRASSQHPSANAIEITVRDGRVDATPTAHLSVGQTITINVATDVSDEVHVHGYDLHRLVTAGSPVSLSFQAAIPGEFEVELEDRHLLLTTLEVR